VPARRLPPLPKLVRRGRREPSASDRSRSYAGRAARPKWHLRGAHRRDHVRGFAQLAGYGNVDTYATRRARNIPRKNRAHRCVRGTRRHPVAGRGRSRRARGVRRGAGRASVGASRDPSFRATARPRVARRAIRSVVRRRRRRLERGCRRSRRASTVGRREVPHAFGEPGEGNAAPAPASPGMGARRTGGRRGRRPGARPEEIHDRRTARRPHLSRWCARPLGVRDRATRRRSGKAIASDHRGGEMRARRATVIRRWWRAAYGAQPRVRLQSR